jgi:hypothetical protein
MQDDSNLRQPPKNHACQVKMYLSKIKTSLKYKISENKQCFTVPSIHWLHKACNVLCNFTNQCQSPSCRSQPFMVRCIAVPLWTTWTKQYISISWFINLPEPIKFTIFSTDGGSAVMNLNVCSGFLSCLWSYQYEFMAFIMVFNLWILLLSFCRAPDVLQP